MRIERILALTLAGVMTASLLTGCPHHTGSDDDSSDDTSSSSSSSESEETPPEAGFTVDAAGTYHVYNEKGLRAWASNPNVQGTNCTLEANITLTGEWEPVPFYSSTFDGQGHTISGLRATGTGQFVSMANGMFGEIQQGCVKDLRLENPVVTRMKDFGFGGLIPPDANNGAIAGKLHGGQIIDGNATEGIGGDPTYSGVTKVDGNTTKWADAVKAMQTASGCQFEVDASGKPTGVG